MRVEITGPVVGFKSSASYDPEIDGMVVTMGVKVKMNPGDLARIHYLLQNKTPISFTIGSSQAAFDFKFEKVTESGKPLPMDEILEAAQRAKAAVDAEAAQAEVKAVLAPETKDENEIFKPVCETALPVELVECPECHGSGQSQDPGWRCEACLGKGSVSARAVDPNAIEVTVDGNRAEPDSNGHTPKKHGRKAKSETPAAT